MAIQTAKGDMRRQRNALALVGLLATVAIATENMVAEAMAAARLGRRLIDFSTRAGWIQPRSVAENTNIATGILERGGRVTSPNAQAVLRLTSNVLEERLHSMVDGDPNTVLKLRTWWPILLVIDLGARFGVNHIRFFPAKPSKATL